MMMFNVDGCFTQAENAQRGRPVSPHTCPGKAEMAADSSSKRLGFVLFIEWAFLVVKHIFFKMFRLK